MKIRDLILSLTVLVVTSAVADSPGGAVKYPPTRTVPVTDDYFGTAVPDPYRWLEDLESTDTAGWIAAQNKVTFAFLDALPQRDAIRDRLTQLAPVFLKNKYMLGENFSMLDVAIAPLLWRMDYYGIELSKNAAPLLKYAERIFSRPAYIEALTPSEKVMRK